MHLSDAPATSSPCYCKHIEEHLRLFSKQNILEIIIWSTVFLLVCLFQCSKGLFSGWRNVLDFRFKEVWCSGGEGSVQSGGILAGVCFLQLAHVFKISGKY